MGARDFGSLAARLTEAADWLESDLPDGLIAPQVLEGDITLDELDAYCVALMREVASAISTPGESR